MRVHWLVTLANGIFIYAYEPPGRQNKSSKPSARIPPAPCCTDVAALQPCSSVFGATNRQLTCREDYVTVPWIGRFLYAEVRIRSRGISYGIYGGQSGTGTGLSPCSIL
jgi:hypothetical protein